MNTSDSSSAPSTSDAPNPASADLATDNSHPFLDKPGEKIQGLFDEIAPRYDLLNRILSFNIDIWWRYKAVQSLRLKPGHKVLDACCGTGDLSMAAIKAEPEIEVIGSDFSMQMLLNGDQTGPQVLQYQGLARDPASQLGHSALRVGRQRTA